MGNTKAKLKKINKNAKQIEISIISLQRKL